MSSITYNGANRPVRFRNEETDTTVDCGYDSQGRRYFKKVMVAGTVTLHHRYIYRGYLQIACVDCTRSGHPALWFVTWDPSQPTATRPLAIQKDGTWFTYGYDLTKNICEVFGPAGYIRTAYAYAPFGAVSAFGDVTQPFQWSSEFYDSELDLVYYNFRHYSPSLGRFLSRDPIQEQGGLNLYAFVGNKPINFGDWKGLEVYAVLDTTAGVLVISDNGLAKTIEAKANTGGRYDANENWIPGDASSEYEVPAPPGKYVIVSEPGDKHEKKDPKDVWFGLFRDDGFLNDKFYDKDRCKKETELGPHKGRLSYGCVTVFKGQEKLWSDIVSLIRSTKQGEPIRYGFCCRNKVLRYGTLIITNNGSKPETASSPEGTKLFKKEKRYR